MGEKIQFRFWDESEEKFVEGIEYAIDQWGNVVPRMSGGLYADIIFQRYVGLDDKNGVPIFEGDIVKLLDDKILYEVKYLPEYTAFTVYLHASGKKLDLSDMICDVWSVDDREVVGNIYQNPDLLKINT
jgi:uncharacterized phage protein (TIGR01671 family)